MKAYGISPHKHWKILKISSIEGEKNVSIYLMAMQQSQTNIQALEFLGRYRLMRHPFVYLVHFPSWCKYKRIISPLTVNLSVNISHIWAKSSLTAACNFLSLTYDPLPPKLVGHRSVTHCWQQISNYCCVVRGLTQASLKALAYFFSHVHRICSKFKFIQL